MPNPGFELSAPGIARWAAVRLTVYLAAMIVTGVVFVAGAAFYSYVWPAPPALEVPPRHVVPGKLAPTADPASLDPDERMRDIFKPGPVQPILLSRLTWEIVRQASVITIDDGRHFNTVGKVSESFTSGDDFVLEIVSSAGFMSNDFGLRTPNQFLVRASDMRWYKARYGNEMRIFAVATGAQVDAAMARAIKQ